MVLTLPTSPGFTSLRWGQMSNTQVFEAPITRSIQSFRLTGERWLGQWQYPQMKLRTTQADWEVFFVELKGRSGRFYGSPPFRSSPAGAGGGTPLIAGASQTGTSLTTDGWPNSTTVLKKGDYFELTNGELKIIKSDVTSNSSGAATLTFEPPLRGSPDDDSAVTISSVKVEMMMLTDESAWDMDAFQKMQFSFAAVESWAAPGS